MVRQVLRFLARLPKKRTLQHASFWALSFLVLLNILKVSAEIQPIDLVYTVVFHIPIVLVVYLNQSVLFPLLLAKQRNLAYSVSLVAGISAGAVFYILLFSRWIDFIFPGYYFIAYYGFWDISLYLAVYVAATSLIKLARGWFRLQQIEQEKTLTELKALKSQVNPHFLFNSLNSIYSLARKNSPTLPETILKLGSLMRYVIYETDVDKIGLQKEIEIISDYIALQKIRTSEGDKVEFKIEGDPGETKIAPLIFLPFIENSFKHGLQRGKTESFIKIKIEITGAVLNFEIENSKGLPVETGLQEYKGIGIENVKKRLGLVYPGAHVLKISENDKVFKVLLQLQLK